MSPPTSVLGSKPHEPISILSKFSGLIISIDLIVFFLIRFYFLERFLPCLYGDIYVKLSETNRRGFVNHHIAGFVKILILIIAAYPFISITFNRSTFHTPFSPGSTVKMGDVFLIVAQMLIAMYIFELLYRVKLSPVAVLHHTGTIIIGQTAIAISLELKREPDADIEFILCTVWGAFDIISEFFPHVAIILYRVYPDRNTFLSRVFLIACIVTATGTVCETLITMWLFGSLWNRWSLAFKISTPLLHIAFSAAQIHGSLVFWRMYRKQQRKREAEKDSFVEIEERVEVPRLEISQLPLASVS